ncbi:MAG: TrkH family potassium uptake protein [Gemmatimonadota bacterium]
MRLSHLAHVVGLILTATALMLLLSGGVALGYGDGDALAFLWSALITAGVGLLLWRTTSIGRDLSIREGYAVVSLAWLAVGAAGALPYLFAGVTEQPVAALFESVSGFTTTGATVFGDIEALPHGILFWRALTQWLGGMGIIVLGIAILPFLGIGGMQLFRAEVPGPTPERLSPRIAQTAKVLWLVYAGLTAAQVALLLLGGMEPFAAVTHGFTTLSTGGFSVRNASIAAYPSAYIQWVIILFMFLAGINFTLHYRALTGRGKGYLADPEWRLYAVLTVAGTMLVFLIVLGLPAYDGLGVERVFRDAAFQVVAISTTTGFVSFDWELWPAAAQFLLLLFMFVGGMAGSTAGGMKTVRVYAFFRHATASLKRAIHPRAVILTRVGRRALRDDDLATILAFILLFLQLFAAGTLVLTLLGHDLLTSIGAAASALGNIGPGLGLVGAVDNYGWMGSATHGVLIFLMLVGRLEIFTVLLLFHPDLWRRAGH